MGSHQPPESVGVGTANAADPWVEFDDMMRNARESAERPTTLRLAFYGRCSTEDNQDPETSRQWQLRAAQALVEPLGGEIVAEYFDIGVSRSLPWRRREQASALLDAVADTRRQWSAVVVGEAQRTFFGSQFSEVAPFLDHHGVTLFVPELGGPYDARNTTHYMLMSITGGMGRGERQVVQTRVRLGMAAQVENQGRYQGGRPPYGYMTESIGPHPNARKAQEGYTLKRLVPDPVTAPVVRRIFSEYLAGRPFREIADGLNRDGLPCPSAHRPEQNPHRRGDGWQISTLSTILSNQRYTGYEFWGKWARVEELIDPKDVSQGYRVRFRRAAENSGVRSRSLAHEPLVSVQDFIAAQRITQSRAGRSRFGLRGIEKKRSTKRPYALRGFLRCQICGRKMEASQRGGILYFRCRSRDLVPGSEEQARHPRNFYIRHDSVTAGLHEWLGEMFAAEHREDTIRTVLQSQSVPVRDETHAAQLEARKRELQMRIDRIQDAIEAGADPAALVSRLNKAHSDLVAAEAELAASRATLAPAVGESELRELLDSLDDVSAEVFAEADPVELADFYRSINLAVAYDHLTREADASVTLPGIRVACPTGGEIGVRGGV